MNLTTDVKIFLGMILVTVVLIVGAVFFMSRQSAATTSTGPVDQAVLLKSDSWSTSTESAKVTVVEFSDFQCPYCKDAETTVKTVLQKHASDVKLIYRQFPLPLHQFAMDAAIAAEAAGKQGKFWQYHDVLFANQPTEGKASDAFKRDAFVKYAKDLGLDTTQFTKDLDDDSTRQRVLNDMSDGNKLGINATPTFYVNGVKLESGYISLLSTVETLLAK